MAENLLQIFLLRFGLDFFLVHQNALLAVRTAVWTRQNQVLAALADVARTEGDRPFVSITLRGVVPPRVGIRFKANPLIGGLFRWYETRSYYFARLELEGRLPLEPGILEEASEELLYNAALGTFGGTNLGAFVWLTPPTIFPDPVILTPTNG